MTNVQITNGVVKYGRTIKTGDFESKRGDVELSFNIAEDADHEAAVRHVIDGVKSHLFFTLGHPEDLKQAVDITKTDATEKPKVAAKAEKPKSAPKMPSSKVADPVETEETLAKAGPKVSVALGDAAAQEPEAKPEENLDDLLGGVQAPRAITDIELMDETQKCQSAVKNSPAIRKLVAEMGVKNPPGRVIDIPQDKRQAYLDGLKGIKPLA